MTTPKTLSASCHCGAVSVRIAQAPDFINECNCSLCDSHGAWWGYFAAADVVVTGTARGYLRGDKSQPVAETFFCPTCGCTTHWQRPAGFVAKHGADMIGVNMRLFARDALAGIELRFPDGRGWDGVGPWGFVREAMVLG